MRPLIIIGALFALIGATSANAASYDCWGPPADYVAKYDTVRLQLQNQRVGYPEKRVYIEWQSWLTRRGEMPGHHSEHLHVGARIPQGQTWLSANGSNYVDLKFTFHNVEDYRVTDIAGSFVTNTGSLGAFSVADRQAAIPALDAAMQLSGDLAVTTSFTSFRVQPTQTNGRKELRFGLTVQRSGPEALVESWKLSARAYMSDSYPGLPQAVPKSDHVSYIREQTIADTFVNGVLKSDYHHAGFGNDTHPTHAWSRDTMMLPQPAAWPVYLQVTDGGGPASLEVNPNHHVHPDTRVWGSDFFMRGLAYRTETVPLGTLPLSTAPSAVHRLGLFSHDLPECALNGNGCPAGVRPDWTNVVVIPFRKG